MHDVALVKFSDADHYLSCVELCLLLCESLESLEDTIEFSTFYERHDQEKSELRLEEVVDATEVLVLSFEQDVNLIPDAVNRVRINKLVFSDCLDRESLSSLRKCRKKDDTKRASSDLLYELKVIERHLLSVLPRAHGKRPRAYVFHYLAPTPEFRFSLNSALNRHIYLAFLTLVLFSVNVFHLNDFQLDSALHLLIE